VTDARRRTVRRVLLAAALPLAIAAVLLAVRLLGLGPTAGDVADRYDEGYYDRAAETAEGLHTWNWVERWIAYFDRGTALAAAGSYNEAIEDLERALELAPDSTRCDVAVNLSLSWERLGDSYMQQGLYAGAQRLYETARAVIDAAGPECAPGEAPRNEEEGRDAGSELAEAADRLDAKRDAAGAVEGVQPDPGSPDGLDEQLERLGEQDQDAADEKAQQEGDERGRGGGGGYTDRPW